MKKEISRNEQLQLPRCRLCGCTENDACIDQVTGETCYWVLSDICSFCALHDEMATFVVQAHIAHVLTQQIPAFSREEHVRAAQLYGFCSALPGDPQ